MWNPPALTATEEGQDEDSVTTQSNGAEDGSLSHGASTFGAHFMFSPFNSPIFSDVPRHDTQGDPSTYPPECNNENNSLCLDLNRLTDSKTDANVKNDKSEFNGEFYHVTDGNNTVFADFSMDQKPEARMNFMPPWCESAACYPIKAHGSEAKNSRISRLPMTSSSSSSSERGSSVLPFMGNFGITGNNNNDVSNAPFPYSSPQNVDGNFLSLGIGGGSTEIKSNSNFSTREIASKLGDPVSSQYNGSSVGQSPTNPWNLTPFTGLASGVQPNTGGLSSSALVGSSRLNPIKFPDLQTPQANPHSSFSAMYENLVFDPTPSSSPSGIPIFPQCGHVAQSPLGTQITGPTSFASEVIPRQQQYSRRSFINASSESSRMRNYLSGMHRGSSVSHAQLGRLIPMTEARRTESIAGVRFPGSVQPVGNLTLQAEGTSTGVANICPSPSSVQLVGHLDTSHNLGSVAALRNSLFPERIEFPIPRVSTMQSVAAGPFPRRLGVQPNEPTVRTIGGTPAIRLPAQALPVRPLVSSGQHQHGMPAQLPTNFPRADISSGQVTPVARYGVRPQGSPFVSHSHLKRQATVNSSTVQLSQRRKITSQPVVIHHSAPHQRPSFPATLAPIPAASHIPPAPRHIKLQAFDGPLEPSGHKCHLCKRDVSFTSEGQVYQPAIPPVVAILPCGHTFHDDCLQRITPEDYSKNPPCIPCALGET